MWYYIQTSFKQEYLFKKKKQEYIFGCFNFKSAFYSFPVGSTAHFVSYFASAEFWTEKEKWTCENRDYRYIPVNFLLVGYHADHRNQKISVVLTSQQLQMGYLYPLRVSEVLS